MDIRKLVRNKIQDGRLNLSDMKILILPYNLTIFNHKLDKFSRFSYVFEHFFSNRINFNLIKIFKGDENKTILAKIKKTFLNHEIFVICIKMFYFKYFLDF